MPDVLAGAIGIVRLRAEAALLARLNAGSGFGDPRVATQIHLRDAWAGTRFGRAAARPSETHKRQAAEVAQLLATATAAMRAGDGDTSRLAVAAARLELSPAEDALLRLAVAYAIDADTRELVHALS